MSEKLNQLFQIIKEDLGLFLSISLGVFLFVLFFQPFPLESFDFNNSLLFVAGFGAIVFLFMVIIRISFPWYIRNFTISNQNYLLLTNLRGLFLLILSSVSFAFYLYYVGSVSITFYIMFKVVLICFAPPVIIRLYDRFKELILQNEILIKEKKVIQHQIEIYEEDTLNKSIEFFSENNTENLKLLIADVAFIKSADNYVEIVYKEDDYFKKKLIRNTLKNIEHQINPYTNFIRCHRICIVNTHYIEKLHKSYNSHWLSIKEFDEKIPVSRQYLLKLKEAI